MLNGIGGFDQIWHWGDTYWKKKGFDRGCGVDQAFSVSTSERVALFRFQSEEPQGSMECVHLHSWRINSLHSPFYTEQQKFLRHDQHREHIPFSDSLT